MVNFSCHVCRTRLSAQEARVGELMRCPQCRTALRVPPPPAAQTADDQSISSLKLDANDLFDLAPERPGNAIAEKAASVSIASATTTPPATQRSAPPSAGPRRALPANGLNRRPGSAKQYGFNCVYCSSRLEATDAIAGQEGQCPTCGKSIIIPILDRYGRLIDPITMQIVKQDPHPVHAYAAAGDRAPRIVRQASGNQIIICPRCGSQSAISSNNCTSCGMPFTMEGTTIEPAGSNNSLCVTSMVLGILGLPCFWSHVLPILAITFGIIGLNQLNNRGNGGRGNRGMAIAGIVCGAIGTCVFIAVDLRLF